MVFNGEESFLVMANLREKVVERYLVYLLVVLTLAWPLIFNVELQPAYMKTADSAYSKVTELSGHDAVVVAIDFGPGTSAENKPQAKLIIEHLMRNRIPFAVTSLYVLASPYLKELPEEISRELHKEDPTQVWEYGRDWVNFGYLPSGSIQLQSLSKSDDWSEYLKFDAFGTSMKEIEVMGRFKTLSNVSMLVEITGLQGLLSAWLQFFQSSKHTPKFIHGCTSISIPEAFAFFSSGQLSGLFEGIAGAAWYEHLLKERFSNRDMVTAHRVNTGVSFAQILIVLLVIFGNLKGFIRK